MPIIWITCGFFVGVVTADAVPIRLLSWVLIGLSGTLIVGGILWTVTPRSQRLLNFPRGLILSVLIAFFSGGIRYYAALPNFQNPEFIISFVDHESPVTITGVIVDFPDIRDQTTNLYVKTESIQFDRDTDSQPVFGKVLARIPMEERVAYGDRVILTGFLRTPPEEEGFSYQEYLKREGIYGYIPKATITVLESNQGNFLLQGVYRLKTRALETLYQLWPDPEASLLAGILLGVETGIPDQVQEAFRETGTTHIIAISGFNITIVAGLFSQFFSRIMKPRQAALGALIGICLYTLLVGADAAVVRAAIMGGLSILAQQIGRRQHGVNAAALASLIMILIDPQLPWDISYQLSISATLGLILYADPLTDWFSNFSSRLLPIDVVQRITQPVSEYFLFTIAAQMMTFPVMLYHFHTFSLNTFLANPAILPAQPPIMLVGGLALISGLVWFPLGNLTAPLVYPFVLYTIRVVEWFNTLPIQAWHTGEINLGWILFIYFLLGVITFGGRLLIFLESLLTPVLVSTSLGIILILIWRGIFSAPNGYLQIYLFDVGTGSSIYLVTPGGQRILINGGPSSKALSDQLGRRQPPFDRNLDLLLIASPNPQDVDALPAILPRFPPKSVTWLGDESLCWEAENLRTELENLDLRIRHGQPGEILEIGDGVRIQVLAESRRGGSMLIEYKHFRGLLTFGMAKEYRDETRMGLDLGEVTLLLLGDNGYQASNPAEWIRNLNPQLLLLSVGIKNSQGLPDRDLIARLGGYSLLRTDHHGTVNITTDGNQMWIQVEKLE